jgi:hypothetical protein
MVEMKRTVFGLLLLSVLSGFGGENLIRNSDFEQGPAFWHKDGRALTVSLKREGGATFLRFEYDGEVGWPRYYQTLTLPSYEGLFQMSAQIRSGGIRDGVGPYVALNFINADGKRISNVETLLHETGGEWQTVSACFKIPKETVRLVFSMILHGRGVADFRAPVLRTLDPAENRTVAPSSAIAIDIAEKPMSVSFLGFGAEDDGWAYTKGNLSHGWGEKELVLRERRIRFLKPSFVRTFIWTGDWVPDGYFKPDTGAQPFRWDSDSMQSKYRTLALYKELGTPVNITCVEWEAEQFGSPWSSKEKTLAAYVTLVEHLVRTKGFENIRYFTLSNEPNNSFMHEGGNFEMYAWFCRNLRREFSKRGLDVEVVAGDDAESLRWFRQCAENRDVYDSCGIFASHQYLKFPRWNAHEQTAFLKSRTDLLDAMPQRKPLLITEFGFHEEEWSNMRNPYMKEFGYAIQLVDYALEGFNLGVSGFNIWTMHEMYYPPYFVTDRPVHHGNHVMEYGLWNYHDDRLRPVYYATSLFTRNTQKGEPVYSCVSADETIVRATVVGDELFFVNKAVNDAIIKINGRETADGKVFTQATVDAQQLSDGDSLKVVDDSTFVLPPGSFGRIPLH